MTKVTIKKQNNIITEIDVNGHAMSAEYGKDVVCAGISTVVIGTCNALGEMTNYDTNQIKISDGRVLIPDISSDIVIQIICRVMIVQLETIEEKYPKYVKVIGGEKNE